MKIIKLTGFAFKNAFRRKIVAALAIIGIAVAITMQVTINSFIAGMDETFNDIFSELVGTFQIQESNAPASFASQLPSNISETIMDFNRSDEIIAVATEQTLPSTVNNYTTILGKTLFGTPMGINVRGVEDLELFMEVYSELDELTEESEYFNESLNECIITYSLYDNNSEVFDIGKTFSILVNTSYSYDVEITGITSSELGGMQQSIMVTGYDIYVPIQVSQNILTELLRNDTSSHFLHYESRGLDSTLFSNTSTNVVAVRTSITNSNDVEEFIDELVGYLEEQYSGMEFSTLSLAAALETMDDLMQTQNVVMTVVSIIIVISGSMGVIIAQLVGVESRSKEFAILKATGWKEGHIIYTVIVESVILGVVGSIVGILLAMGAINGLETMIPMGVMSAIITPGIIFTAIGIAMTIGILGGLYPGIRASSVRPMEVLQGG